jgi:hypothetical protein
MAPTLTQDLKGASVLDGVGVAFKFGWINLIRMEADLDRHSRGKVVYIELANEPREIRT